MSASCWSCGGDTAPELALTPLPFVRCRACGLVFRPEEGIEAVYTGGDYQAAWADEYADEPARRADARVRLAFLRPWAASGRLLDVGAAGGEFVAEASAAGYAARGIEPSPAFAERAREHLGADVTTATVADADLPLAGLDVVTLWHVLEHVPHPVVALARLASALVPGGAIAIEVPNYGGLDAQRDGREWASLQPDVHVSQFSPDALRRLLERAGFEVAAVQTTAITPYLPWRARLDPRHAVARARAAVALRDLHVEHPWGHELLRAVARTPARAGTRPPSRPPSAPS